MTSLTDFLPALRACIAGLSKPGLLETVQVTALDEGLDVLVRLRGTLNNTDNCSLTGFAERTSLLRLCTRTEETQPERLHDSGNVTTTFAGITVPLPPGAFLQATQEGQEAIAAFITGFLGPCNAVADLYAGCGSHAFAVHEQAKRITAFEGDSEMVTAMHNALLTHGLDDRMSSLCRDLHRQPLRPEELRAYDAVIINPPRAGALSQCQQLSQSTVKKIAMISCSPATFRRDARVLLAGGYRLTSALAIDQFLWSDHLEIAAGFER